MKKIIFLFTVILFFMQGVSAKTVEFSVVSGLALQADSSVKNANLLTPSIKNFYGAIEQINASPAEFTVFSGNNIASADKYSLVMFAKILKKLKKPVYVTVGEKDVAQTKDLDKKEYYRILNLFSKNKIFRLPQAKKINGFVFIFTDGVNQFIPSRTGYFKENEIMAIDRLLKKYKNYPVIIVGHYPVFASRELGEDKLPVKIENYQKMLERHNNVKVIISGHGAIEDEFEANGIYNVYVQNFAQDSQYKKVSIDYDEKTGKTFVKTRIYKVEN